MRNAPITHLASILGTTLVAVVCAASRLAAADPAPGPAPIVGGTEAKPGDWPDVVAILGEDGGLCSGTLLAPDLVLTAGHCIEMNPAWVIVGSVDLARPGGDRRAVKWSRAYPSWIERYDVGIVMLENPVQVKQRGIAQGCTSRPQFDTGFPVQIVGFGLTTASGTGDNTRLHQATVPLMDPTCTSDPACAPAIAPGGEFTAGGNGKDACFGDSGGPVYINTAQGHALIGVVSRGVATSGEPCAAGGVYVRADKVVSWIQSVSERKLDRVPCELPTDDAGSGGGTSDDSGGNDGHGASDGSGDGHVLDTDAGGCNAAGPIGPVGAGLALYYAALVVLGMRRARARRAVRTGGLVAGS